MVKKYMQLALLAVFSLLFTASCVDEDEMPDTPRGNLEALWKIIDEHYCFLDYKKQEYGLDWNEVHDKYVRRVDDTMTKAQLFEVLAQMLGELRDGHVNLSSPHDYGRYWTWQSYPTNFSDSLLRVYLGTDYKMAAGIDYKVLDDNIGYVRYDSFMNGIGAGNLDEVILHLMPCNGLIIDIRGNGGGNLTNAEKLAARFCDEKTMVGYIRHKTGPGHNDFSKMEERYVEPSSSLRWHKPVVVLTNRHVFSAANEFVMYMKQMPRVTIVGDRTGGGAGLPFSSSLPCGWSVRFSAVPIYDVDRVSCEHGIEPDHYVQLNDDDFARGKDTVIEFARALLAK